MWNILRKYRGIFSLSLAVIVVGAAYLLAWMPVLGKDFQIQLENTVGNPSAMGDFVITGTLTDGQEKTDFSLDSSGLSQKSQAISPKIREKDSNFFDASTYFLPGETVKEELSAVPKEEPGWYEITQKLWSRQIQLVWDIQRFFFYSPTDSCVRINTGLTHPETACLTKSLACGSYESTPSEEIIRENLSQQNYSPSKDLQDTILGEPNAGCVAEVDGSIYFVPTVSEIWEGTRYIYRIDRGESWAATAFAGAEESFGQVTPIAEVKNGSELDILGIYATLDGTLVLRVMRQGTILFQMYNPETGEMTGEVSAPGLWLVEGANFRFFSQKNGFCASFIDYETEVSTLVALSGQNASWQLVQDVRQVSFLLESAMWDGENLAAVGSKRQRLDTKDVIRSTVWNPDGLIYDAQLNTIAEQDHQNEGGTRRFLQNLCVERRDSHD